MLNLYAMILSNIWIYLFICFIVGFLAFSRGRNLFAWVILSLIITPVGSLIALMVQADLRKEKEEEKKHQEIMSKLTNNLIADDTKNCPYCAESIKKEAVYCRFCQHPLN